MLLSKRDMAPLVFWRCYTNERCGSSVRPEFESEAMKSVAWQQQWFYAECEEANVAQNEERAK